jgi:rhamnosyl/mannosyltransferase
MALKIFRDRPLRVCHLGKYYPPASGGMETHVQTLARAQAAQGVETQVVCVNHADQDISDLSWLQMPVTQTVQEYDGAVRLIRAGRTATLARLDICPDLLPIFQQFRRTPYDLLHLHAPNPLMVLALALLRPRMPLVITHHSDIIRQRLLRYALRPFDHRVYARAAVILSDSPTYAAGSPILQHYAAKVQDLPLGLDLTPYLDPNAAARDEANRLRARHGAPLWLAVGRLVYYKGLHVALEALAQVPGSLMIIGTGPLEADLKRRAERLGVANRVVWRGYASPEELVGAYHAATAFWFPSNARSEGFGLVQVEAMASGCPVLNAAIPASGVAWVSRHEESGLTVPVNDADALARAARRLLTEPGLHHRLAAGARQRACREFDHEVMAQRSLAIYRRVVVKYRETGRDRKPARRELVLSKEPS